MLLLVLMDIKQITAMGLTEGYAMTLEFADDWLWIRPFYSEKDTRPLAGTWSTGVGDDDIDYEGPCLYFAECEIELYVREFIAQEFGFKLHVIRFFINH